MGQNKNIRQESISLETSLLATWITKRWYQCLGLLGLKCFLLPLTEVNIFSASLYLLFFPPSPSLHSFPLASTPFPLPPLSPPRSSTDS